MNTPLRVVALDLGIANVGIAVTHDQVGEPRLSCRTVTPRRREPRPNVMDHERVQETVAAVLAAMKCEPHVVAIELPIIADNTGDTPIRLAEIHGALKHWIFAHGIPYADVNNMHVKQYATGNGHADKDVVKAQVIARYGRLLHIHTRDEADAVSLLAQTLDAYGHPLCDKAGVPIQVPASHRRAVAATTWPELTGRSA